MRTLLLAVLLVSLIPSAFAVVSFSSLGPSNNTITLDTTPNFTGKVTSTKDTSITVTLYVEGVASGTSSVANNTVFTITCNHTLTRSDSKYFWYFNGTDTDGTVSSATSYIGIGPYFLVPAVLVNDNSSMQNWVYYLNGSVTNDTRNTLIYITDHNITLDGKGYTLDGDDSARNPIFVYGGATNTSTFVTVKNLILTDWYQAVYLNNADNNTIENIVIKSSSEYGMTLTHAVGNVIHDSKIIDSVGCGVLMDNAACNTFYNNYFNNNLNVNFTGTVYTNSWNTTKQLGTRVYGYGSEIGGNFWTNSTGGVSVLGNDTNHDGFLDSLYNLTAGNIDYLPYSDEYKNVNLTYPDGGETVSGVATVTWTYSGVPVKFSLYYSLDSGSTWALIASGIDSSRRSYGWDTSSIPYATGLVKIVASSSDPYSDDPDVSDSLFTINNVGGAGGTPSGGVTPGLSTTAAGLPVWFWIVMILLASIVTLTIFWVREV